MSSPDDERFHSFAEFYPYYLQEHSNAVCRRLHYVGSLLVLAVLFLAVNTQGSSPAHEAYPPRPLADEPVRRVHA